MRYRESTEVDYPPSGVDSDMMAATVLYTLVLGLAFVVVGLRNRQRWLAFWGGTMVVAGTAYIAATVLGY